MKYKVKWVEDHMGITRNMIRRYEKKGVILKNEKGRDREFDESELIQLWNIRVLVSMGFTLDEVKEIIYGNDLDTIIENKLVKLQNDYRDLKGKINFLNSMKITGEIPRCFSSINSDFEKIYNLGLIQYASPFEKEKDIWMVLEMLVLLHKLSTTENQRIIEKLYEWYGESNDKKVFVQALTMNLMCDQRFEKIFGKELCKNLANQIVKYGNGSNKKKDE